MGEWNVCVCVGGGKALGRLEKKKYIKRFTLLIKKKERDIIN